MNCLFGDSSSSISGRHDADDAMTPAFRARALRASGPRPDASVVHSSIDRARTGGGEEPRKPVVSVIVPTYNRGDRIRACLDALRAQHTGKRYEIIVVDDGSTDDTAKVAGQYPSVRVIRQPNAGPARARNHGVEEAHGEIVLFTDDDCVPEPGWLDRMIAVFDDPRVAGAKGAYRTRQTSLVARFVQLEYEEKYSRLQKYRDIDFVDSYSAAFRRRVFQAAGGYDTGFPSASVEDQEFSFRLASAGHVLRFIPDALVWHTHADTLRGYVRKKFKIGYWKVRILAANPGKTFGDNHTPHTLKLQIVLAALFPLSFAAAIFGPRGLLVPAAVLVAFLASAIPLVARCFARDPLVGLVAPGIIACRAAALAAGLLAGSLRRSPA